MKSSECTLMGEQTFAAISGSELKAFLESFLSEGKSCRMRANGSSMTPFIRHGDVVTIAPTQHLPRRGEIVAASDKDGRRVLLHRVVGFRKEGGLELLLRGDSVVDEGDWVPLSSVLGRVTGISRNGSKEKVYDGALGRLLVWLSRRLHGVS